MRDTKMQMREILSPEEYQKWVVAYDNRKPLSKDQIRIEPCGRGFLSISMYECPEGVRWWDKVAIENIDIKIGG